MVSKRVARAGGEVGGVDSQAEQNGARRKPEPFEEQILRRSQDPGRAQGLAPSFSTV